MKKRNIFLVYSIAILVGLLVGVVGSLFQRFVGGMDHLLSKGIQYLSGFGVGWSVLFSSLASMLMVVTAWYLVQRFSQDAAGSGVHEIEGVLQSDRKINWHHLLPVKFIGGILAISSKLVLGREGPTIQMGGTIGAMVAEGFGFNRKNTHVLVATGAAAGLAVAFNAPLAGALFVLEEMYGRYQYSLVSYQSVIIGCMVATVVLQRILGGSPDIPMIHLAMPHYTLLWVFALFGLCVGAVGLLFNVSLIKMLDITERLSFKVRLSYVALVGLVIGAVAVLYPELVGGGYSIIEKSLVYRPGMTELLVFLVIRFVFTMLSYGTGVPGGIFAPLLALGTLLGLALTQILTFTFPDLTFETGVLAAVGMGALFSATVRAPITAIILVVEMTQQYDLILPLMTSCVMSSIVMQWFKNPPIYSQLLARSIEKEKVIAVNE